MSYGQQLMIDLMGCDPALFTRETIKPFLADLCKLIDAEPEEQFIWDYDTPEERADAPAHMGGLSFTQFISKSDITGHCIDHGGLLLLDIFICGELPDKDVIMEFLKETFKPKTYRIFGRITRGVGWNANSTD